MYLVQFHGVCSFPPCLPAFCSPFHPPSQSVIPSLLQRELWMFCAGENQVRRVLPCVSMWRSPAKLPALFNTGHRGRFHLRTRLDLSGQKLAQFGHIADFCSIFQDSQDLLTGSQFNFIIYKHKHYRWQKRILQVTLKTLTFEMIYEKYRMISLLSKCYVIV